MVTERDTGPTNDENDFATAEADRFEQEQGLTDAFDAEPDGDVPEGVDPADAHEQQLTVEYDEDDYR